MILKGYFYVWGLSVDLVYPGSLVVMAVVIVDTSHIFPQSVLAAITLIRSVIGVGEAKAQAQSVSRTFCLLSGCHFLSGLRSAPHIGGTDALRVRLRLTIFSLSVFFLLPALRPLPQRRGVAVVSVDCVLSEVLCIACVGICDSTQMQSKVIFFPSWGCSRSSAR